MKGGVGREVGIEGKSQERNKGGVERGVVKIRVIEEEVVKERIEEELGSKGKM